MFFKKLLQYIQPHSSAKKDYLQWYEEVRYSLQFMNDDFINEFQREEKINELYLDIINKYHEDVRLWLESCSYKELYLIECWLESQMSQEDYLRKYFS